MDRFAAWFWRRFRPHFLWAMWATAVLTLTLGLVLPVTYLSITITESAVTDFGLPSLVSFLVVVAAVTLGVFTLPQVSRPIQEWIKGDHSDPIRVRDAAIALPQRMAIRGVTLVAPLGALNIYSYAEASNFGAVGIVGLSAVAIYSYLVAAFLIGVGFRVLIRPLLDEVAVELVNAPPPAVRMWSIRARWLLGTFSACVATGIGSGAAAFLWADEPGVAVTASFTAALGVGAYATLLNRFGLIEPTLRPLRDLTAATERVRLGDFSQPMPITSTDELGDVILGFNDMMIGLQQREALNAAFGSYVDPSLARRLLAQNSSVFAGELVEATVFFADVRGFTNYAETVEPEEAVAQLNRLFEILVPAIRSAGGHPNRYIGDGVLAVFGTPEPLPNHANRAVSAAVLIQREVRRVFGDELHLGIGINSGKVIAGTIGGGGKLDFTVIGDVVNVAARIEELTKETGDRILVTRATLDRVRAPKEIVVPRGPQPLRGRNQMVEVFAIQT
ncbi:MAG: adenylate cyclase [Actinomycetota bacterium]|jgi:class 3 adenylate cyclase